jgi:peptidoglycan/LPS O-acetylase OafA/YrhL
MLLSFTPFRAALMVVFATPLIVLAAARIEPPMRPMFLALGTMSYAFYCLHYPAELALRVAATHFGAATSIMTCGLMFVAAMSLVLGSVYDPWARRVLASIVGLRDH